MGARCGLTSYTLFRLGKISVMMSRCMHIRALRVPSSGGTGPPALPASRCQEHVNLLDEREKLDRRSTHGKGFSWMGRQHKKAIKLAVAWKMNTICSALPYASTAAFRISGSKVGIIDVECRMASMICGGAICLFRKKAGGLEDTKHAHRQHEGR